MNGKDNGSHFKVEGYTGATNCRHPVLHSLLVTKN